MPKTIWSYGPEKEPSLSEPQPSGTAASLQLSLRAKETGDAARVWRQDFNPMLLNLFLIGAAIRGVAAQPTGWDPNQQRSAR